MPETRSENVAAVAALVAFLAAFDRDALIQLARDADRLRGWNDAAHLWEAVRWRLPDELLGYTGQAVALRQAGRFDEADAILRIAIERFPDAHSPPMDFAYVAMFRDDQAEAVRRWELVRRRFPDILEGYTVASIAMRGARRWDEAERILAEAMRRFPDSSDPLVEHAYLAQVAGDLSTAVTRWETLRARAPDRMVGYTAAAQALRELGRVADAEILLREALARFPDDPSPAIEMARMVMVRQAWHEAEQLWSGLLSRFPDRPECYLGIAQVQREMGQVEAANATLRAMADRFPDDPTPLWERAWLASWRRDWNAAIELWAKARPLFPARVEPYILAARAMCEAWRHEDAETLLTEAMERFPGSADVLVEFARVARHQNRFAEALVRYRETTTRFPEASDAWLECARVMHDLARLAEAETLLIEAIGHCPGDARLYYEHAILPAAGHLGPHRNYPEALQRLEQLRVKFPDFETGYTMGVQMLRDSLQPEAAEELARAGYEKLPASRQLALLHSGAAELRAGWAEALQRFAAARDRFPDDVECEAGVARALAALGRADEAEARTRELMTRAPGLQVPFATYARIAAIKQDWSEAARRWADAARRFPEEREFARAAYEANMRVIEMEAQNSAAFAAVGPAPKPDPAAIDQNVLELAMQFTSLGGSAVGCEFGIFQRRCGAEPLDLLRWADMRFEMLLFALDTRFDGVGSEEHTELILAPVFGGRKEYCTQDRRGMMNMHSFTYDNEIAFDKMYQASCRRLRYLSQKLVHDLETGDKIFVYRLTHRTLTPAEIDCLHAAMRCYGDNTLLYVRHEDDAHPSGTVEIVRPGLMIGYMDHFMLSPEGDYRASPATNSWLAICKAAYTSWNAGSRDD